MKKTTFLYLPLVCSLLAFAPGFVLGSAKLGAQGKNASPLAINASEGIEWNRDKRQYIAKGDAHATQDGMEIFADQLIAHYREEENQKKVIYRLDAAGQVRIQSEGRQAFGQEGIYDIDQQVMILHGDNLKITNGADTITARDSLVYWEGKDLAVARGDATAIHEDKRVFAQVLTAHFVESDKKENGGLEIDRIDAYGDVRVSSKSEYASGDKGSYDVTREIATLEGNVKLTQGDNQLNGDRGEVNWKTGESRLLSDGSNPVRGLIFPTSKDKN